MVTTKEMERLKKIAGVKFTTNKCINRDADTGLFIDGKYDDKPFY